MTLRSKLGIAIILGASLTAGCAKRDLVGKWEGSLQAPEAPAIPASIEFKKDETFAASFTAYRLVVRVDGQYEVEGSNLTLTPKNSSAMGAPIGTEKAVAESAEKMVGKKTVNQITWKGADDIELLTEGSKMILRRKEAPKPPPPKPVEKTEEE